MKDDTWQKKTIRTALHDVRCVKDGLASDGHWVARLESYGVTETDARKHLNAFTERDGWMLAEEMERARATEAVPVTLSGRRALMYFRGFVEFKSEDGRSIWVPWHQRWAWNRKGAKATAALPTDREKHRLIVRDAMWNVVAVVMACLVPSESEILSEETTAEPQPEAQAIA